MSASARVDVGSTAAQKKRFPRAAAIAAVKPITQALSAVTERLIVAGSLRRRKESVGDVEIVFIPKAAPALNKDDLFQPPKMVDLASAVIWEFCLQQVIAPRANALGAQTWGEKNKLAVHIATDIPIDFFATTEEAWFNYLVCRTGSALNNTRIASAAIAKGWKWHNYDRGFTDQEGNWVVVRSEREVFELVGLKYLEPWER